MDGIENSKLPRDGARDSIDRELLLRHLFDLNGPIYYAAGPPAMVTVMRQLLTRSDVDEDDVRTQEFGGY